MVKKEWKLLKLFMPIILLLIIIPFVFSEVQAPNTGNISISVIPVKDHISEGDWGIVDIKLINNYREADFIRLSVREDGVDWSVITESAIDYATGFDIQPKKTKIVRLLLKEKGLIPNSNKPYAVTLDIISDRESDIKPVTFKIYVVPEPTIIYESDILMTPNIPRYIDPRNIYSFNVGLTNNNPKDIKELEIILESTLVNRHASISLEPKNEKTIEYTIEFDKEQKPVLDTLTITIEEKGELLHRETVPFEIVSYRIPFSKELEVKKEIFGSTQIITVTNNENAESQKQVTEQAKYFDNWFSSTDPQSELITEETEEGIDTIHSWSIKLKPGESTTIILKRNYAFPIIIIMFIIIFVGVYYIFRNPIVVIKQAEVLKTVHGGISELKVIIIIKNRKNEGFKNLRVVDMIPEMIHMDKNIKVGTLHPDKILRKHHGTLLDWKFDLDEKEERIITYKVSSKLSILGGLKLPQTMIQIEKDGKKKKIKSNELFVSS